LRVDECSAPRLPVSDHRALVVDMRRAVDNRGHGVGAANTMS
jgi:hypothetical protein